MRNQKDMDFNLEHVNILNSSISDLKNAVEHLEGKIASVYCDWQILQSSKERAILEEELKRLDFMFRRSVVIIKKKFHAILSCSF